MIRRLFIFCLAVLGTPWAANLQARDQTLRFLHALQERGYGDMAVDYLKSIETRGDLPPPLRDGWDLEMSKSYKAAAADAFDAKEYEAMMEQSQKHLAKFIKEKPNHPDAVIAMASWGGFLAKRAMDSIRSAKLADAKDKQQSEQLMAEARKNLDEARDNFQRAEKKFTTRLAELPAPKQIGKRVEKTEATEARQQAEANLNETRLQLAMIDYYVAQTYTDPKSAERTEALQKSAKALDAIYQRNRGNVTGIWAHAWHGKTVEELGNLQTALDIYDEVLANAPEPTERGPAMGLESFFAQVEQFRLVIVAKQTPKQFLKDAVAWLKEYRKLRSTDGYQGIALEVAKASVVAAKKTSGVEKAKLTSEAMQLANDCSKVRSQYQQEFAILRRELLKDAGRQVEIGSFEEAVSLGNAAANDSEWEQALSAYRKALELAEKTKLKTPTGIAAVREAMGRVQLIMARDLFNKGKFDDCMTMTCKITLDENGTVKKESAAAAKAAALAVSAALNVYVSAAADKKPAALQKLMEAAEFTEKNWPYRPEADDARVARGQANIAVGKIREAIEIFDLANPKSERYATAMFMAGQNYWRLYLAEKLNNGGSTGNDQMAADREKTRQRLVASVDAFKKQSEPGKPAPKYMADALLLLAEVYNEAGEYRKATELYQPLVDQLKAEKLQSFDNNTIRIFMGAVRAYCALDEIDRVGQTSDVLMELDSDSRQVNEVLVEFAKLLNLERKKADALATELEGAKQTSELSAAKAKRESIQKLLRKTLVKLSRRNELGLGQMMFIGETLNAIGMANEASSQFQRILKRTETDEDFAKQAQKAMSLIRTELLKVLRRQEHFEEALKQVDQLIKENPRALEPLMEKGRILEAWAEKDPAKFEQAVSHWVSLRTKLQTMKRKPNDYYDVMYNVAKCLVREAEMTKDKITTMDRAKKAEQVLKAALTLSPKLNGADTVARYKVLLHKAITIQGLSTEPKVDKKP